MNQTNCVYRQLYELAVALCSANYYITFIVNGFRYFFDNPRRRRTDIEDEEAFEICEHSAHFAFTWAWWPLKRVHHLTIVARGEIEGSSVVITAYSQKVFGELHELCLEDVEIRLEMDDDVTIFELSNPSVRLPA